MNLLEKTKVFNVGLPKTGTSSFGKAMQILGYKFRHWDYHMSERVLEGLLEDALLVASNHEAFADFPWASIYKDLDERFPGSKFILTFRDPKKWLASNLSHFDEHNHPETIAGGRFREHFFGYAFPKYHESEYLNKYEKHNAEVENYFKGRHNFLSMNWENNDGWKVLTNFLELSQPDVPFPHVNKGEDHGRKSVHLQLLV